jgi:hypothetical protein
MRGGILLTIVSLQAALPGAASGAFRTTAGGQVSVVPWQIVSQKVLEGSLFCENVQSRHGDAAPDARTARIKLEEPANYACRPRQSLVTQFPAEIGKGPASLHVDIAGFTEGSWHGRGEAGATGEPNRLTVPGVIGEEGFFRLRLGAKSQDNQSQHGEAYAIVCENWKKDILTFCRIIKEQIETNRDLEMIRSSISVSHFDHMMELISESPTLSRKVLTALAEAVQSKEDFDSGRCPALADGLNKIRFRPFAGAPIEEFVVFVPKAENPSRPQPLLLRADDGRWGPRDNYRSRSGLVDIWWHTVSHRDIRWKAYRAFMDIIEQKIPIDDDRVYVEGPCVNAIGAMALALNYPDQWAECSCSLGNSYRHLAGNAYNLPMVFVKGGHTEDPLVGYYDFAVKCFQYHNCKHFKHSDTQEIPQVRGAVTPQAVRERKPLRVLYTIESLKNPRAYWVRICGRDDENLPATIDACVWGQTVLVKTENINGYVLDLVQAPLDVNRPVEITENGKSLGFTTANVFTRKRRECTDASYVKSERLHGPVSDAFTDPYVVVWGTASKDRRYIKANEQTARTLAKGAPCFADVNLPKELVDTHNLILVGRPRSGLRLAEACKALPVGIMEGKIRAGDKVYEGRDIGFMLVHPNPLKAERYAAVFSGTSLRAITSLPSAYAKMTSTRPADVGIFEVTGSGGFRWHMIEKLNTAWSLHESWDRILGATKKKHPEWQWHRWIARTLRERLRADVVVCEDPFQLEDAMPLGQFTYRDLFNGLRNNWIIVVRIDGKSLRGLLTVPFGSIFKQETKTPVIDGASLIKGPADAGGRTLVISELSEEATYTVALPEKCLNGQRMGLVLENYRIVGQAYLVPTLGEYLDSNKDMDLDAQLDSLKFRIF